MLIHVDLLPVLLRLLATLWAPAPAQVVGMFADEGEDDDLQA